MHPSESFWYPFRIKINLLFLRHQFQVTFFFLFVWLCCLCPLSDFISDHSSKVPNGNCKVIHLINVLNKLMKPRSWVSVPSINQSRWHLLKSHSLLDANRIVERGLAWSYRGILFQHPALLPQSSVWVSVCLSLPLGLKWKRLGMISGIKASFAFAHSQTGPSFYSYRDLLTILNVETLFLTTLLSSQLYEDFWRRTE